MTTIAQSMACFRAAAGHDADNDALVAAGKSCVNMGRALEALEMAEKIISALSDGKGDAFDAQTWMLVYGRAK